MGKYKFVAGVRGRRARIKNRKGIRLRDAGITKQTQSRYYLAVREVTSLIDKSQNFAELDSDIADWIEYKFSHGYPINVVADCLSGIHFFLPQTRRQLPESWKLFGVWRKIEVPSRAPPITSDLLMAMASRALSLGRLDFATLLLLGFHCFLRTGELLTVTPSDLLLGKQKGIVRLPTSKGKTRRLASESVTIEDQRVLLVAQALVELRTSQHLEKVPIWQFSGSSFRQTFYRYVHYFDVGHLGFRCYSLRRGGATAFFADCGLMEKTLLRGRWGSTSVACIYICDALAQLPALKAKPRTLTLLKKHTLLSSPHAG